MSYEHPFIEHDRVVGNDDDELTQAVVLFANEVYEITKRANATKVQAAEWTFFIADRNALLEALAGFRSFAMGAVRDLQRLQANYVHASYGLMLVLSTVLKCTDYQFYSIAAVQRDLARALMRALSDLR